ncbi:hypothetical protein H0H93_001023 [Arthromyces matolae]|nr:hypothetical protein H0H93_001023 [Arthromyces matolae]
MYKNTSLVYLCLALLTAGQVVSYDPLPRWGQAVAIINDRLFVHGGKTDPYNSYGYTSAPNSNDLLSLSLSTSFSTSSPPWQLLNLSSDSSNAASPALSWHTLSAFDDEHMILFGGEPDPNSATVLTGLADSVYLLDVTNQSQPWWSSEPVGWAEEPVRRIHHSVSSTAEGNVYIIGGEKADGSGIVFSEHYAFNPSISTFTLLPSDNSPYLTGHASVVLPDGRVLVFGGYSPTLSGLVPFTSIWILDTSKSSLTWSLASVDNTSVPSSRRAFAVATTSDGKVLIHGGSDALLQNDLEDGWILDPSQKPMTWAQVDLLSQLGYGDDKPAPAYFQIFNTKTSTFDAIFSPPSSPNSPTVTSASQASSPHQSPTGSSAAHGTSVSVSTPTTTSSGGSHNGDGANETDQDHKENITGIAVGSTIGFLGLVAAGIAAIYYVRRHQRHPDGGRHFRALENSDGYDDAESEHLAGNIPTAGSLYTSTTTNRHQGWDFGVLDTLNTTLGTGAKKRMQVPQRKDILADEDTRVFAPWYADRSREGSVDRAWSLRTIMSSLKMSREPSYTGTSGGVFWREKSDPFSDEVALMREEGIGDPGTSVLDRGKLSYASRASYHDPFADPAQEISANGNENDEISNQPYLHPIPPQLPTLRTLLPVPRDAQRLSPLSEDHSHDTALDENLNSVSSHTSLHISPFDTTSVISSHTSFGTPPKSLLPLPSSIAGASSFVRRSDSWWSRFARTSFLDRRSSIASKQTLDFRDPNPPPRLEAIKESSRMGSVDSQSKDSSDPISSSGISRSTSRVQGSFSKSQTSVKTTDTEAIEKMARTMDVAHLMRSDSRRSTSTATTNLSIDASPWIRESSVALDPEPIVTSPLEMADVANLSDHNNTILSSLSPTSASVIPVTYPPTSYQKQGSPPSSASVAARIQELERRQSADLGGSDDPTTLRSKQRASMHAVGYGLVPRASLFIANPDR